MEAGTTPKIYLVDNDIFYNRTLQHALWHSEFINVKTFTSREDFLKELSFEEPDMVILDYHPGDTKGIEIIEKVKSWRADINLIILSAQEKTETTLEAFKKEAFRYIKKDKLAIPKLKVIARKMKLEKIRKSKEKSICLV